MCLLWGCANTQLRSQGSSVQVETLRVDYNNVHVVWAGERVVIVDAGVQDDADEIIALIKAQGVTSAQVEGIFVTHGHPDHVGSARELAAAFTAPIIAGSGDRDMLARGHVDTAHEQMCPTNSMARRRMAEDSSITFSPVVADLWVDKTRPVGELIPGLEGRIIAQQSHTPGSLVLIMGDSAFVGDLFRGAIVGKSAETHFYVCDLDKNRAEIAELMAITPPIKTFFTGHFGPVSRDSVQTYLEEHE
jgi:hydroxyacylglutathione hydrolase